MGRFAIAVLATGLTCVAGAHHSVAAFDRAHPVTLSGTVTSFTYANPHSWIYLTVQDGPDAVRHWALEGSAVNTLYRQGWTAKTLRPGMRIQLLAALRRDGQPGGEWLKVLEIEGTPVFPDVVVQPAED